MRLINQKGLNLEWANSLAVIYAYRTREPTQGVITFITELIAKNSFMEGTHDNVPNPTIYTGGMDEDELDFLYETYEECLPRGTDGPLTFFK
jgi:hypothetical protein